MYQLDIELEPAQDIRFLGPKKQHFLRIGRLGPHNNNATFNAKDQAKRFLEGEDSTRTRHTYTKGWEPKRLRATRQQNEFVCTTSLDLAISLVKNAAKKAEKEDDDEDEEDEPKKQSIDKTNVVDESSTPSKKAVDNNTVVAASTTAAVSPHDLDCCPGVGVPSAEMAAFLLQKAFGEGVSWNRTRSLSPFPA